MSTKFVILFPIVVLSFYSETLAQYDPSFQKEKSIAHQKEPKCWWFDAGLGLVGEEMGYQASFNIQLGSRFLVAVGFDRADYIFNKPEEFMITNSISGELGYVIKARSIIGYFTVGPSYNWGEIGYNDGFGTTESYNRNSLKFKAGCLIRKVHLGFSPFFHFNPENAYAGLTVNLVIGKNIRFRQ